MKKVFATLMAAALMLMGLQAFAQDIILKKDNTMVRANIEEINGENVVYHAFDNPDGPLFKLPISQVAKIQFKNGTEQVFDNTPAPAVASPYVAPGYGLQGKLTRDDSEVYLNGRALGDEEIKAIIGQQLWDDTFASARGQYKAGKVLTNIGIPFTAAGGGLMLAGFILAATGSTKSSTYEAGAILVGVGAPFFGTGMTLLTIGIPLKCIGNGRLNWVVDEANKNNGYAMQPKLNFGFQQNGVGVALRF